MVDLVALLVALAVILAGAELFTNGVEWMGHRLDLAEGAVGSVLAAVGTALPETMIPLIAILFGGRGAETDAIGLGAILGAPFMISTLAMFVTGLAVLAVARGRATGDVMTVSTVVVGRDVRWFVLTYVVALAAALVPVQAWPVRPLVAIAILLLYARYVQAHLSDERADADDPPPLRLHRLDRSAWRADASIPRLRVVGFQVLIAVAAIVAGAVVFVEVIGAL